MILMHSLAGCKVDVKEGPAEEVGEAIDEATDADGDVDVKIDK